MRFEETRENISNSLLLLKFAQDISRLQIWKNREMELSQ